MLFGKPERKRSLGGRRRRWEDNIRIDLWETKREIVDWFHLSQVWDLWRVLVNTVMNLWVPLRWEISGLAE
jgi:hypothetical protein